MAPNTNAPYCLNLSHFSGSQYPAILRLTNRISAKPNSTWHLCQLARNPCRSAFIKAYPICPFGPQNAKTAETCFHGAMNLLSFNYHFQWPIHIKLELSCLTPEALDLLLCICCAPPSPRAHHWSIYHPQAWSSLQPPSTRNNRCLQPGTDLVSPVRQ